MAGKGGGAWKVAYADFVTAMMAFFMVMWICSQDQKYRQAVARYFNNPSNIGSLGSSKVPNKPGSLFDAPNGGDLPSGESIAMGQGRFGYSAPRDTSPPTKLVSDWIHHDKATIDYWNDQAKRARDASLLNPSLKTKREKTDEAVLKLARQMRQEIVTGFPTEAKGLYRDMLFRAVSEVNWIELAEDMMPAD